MADLQYRTQNVSIEDETTGTLASVNSDNELAVHDIHLLNAIGSPAGASYAENLYTFADEITLGSSAEYDYVLIDNPSDSGVNMRFWRIRLGALNNITVIWHLYFDPTVTTNGTTYTPINTNNGSTNTSAVNIYTSPTISARGNVVDTVVGRVGNTAIPFDYSFVIQPGEKGLFTLEASSANNDFTMTFIWSEEAV